MKKPFCRLVLLVVLLFVLATPMAMAAEDDIPELIFTPTSIGNPIEHSQYGGCLGSLVPEA